MNKVRSISDKVTAVFDSILAVVFVFHIWILLHGMDRMEESAWNHWELPTQRPSRGSLIGFVFPDEWWSLIPCLLMSMAGLAAHSLAAQESSIQRIYRWTCVIGFIVIANCVAGLLRFHMCLCGSEDTAIWDDLLSLAITGTLFWTGLRRLRSRSDVT